MTESATGRGGGTGAGRPGRGRTAQIPPLRVEPELRTTLEEMAQARGRTLADEVRDALERHVAAHRT